MGVSRNHDTAYRAISLNLYGDGLLIFQHGTKHQTHSQGASQGCSGHRSGAMHLLSLCRHVGSLQGKHPGLIIAEHSPDEIVMSTQIRSSYEFINQYTR